MSDTARDSRPDWMLDPSLTEIDEDAIAAVGNAIGEQTQQIMESPFVTRTEMPPVSQGQDGQPPATASTDSPSGAASADGAPPAAPLSSAGEGGGGEAPPSTIGVQLPDGSVAQLTQEQVFALMQNYEWMRTRPPEVLSAWGGIESGTHQAVPSTEYAEFQRWKATQGVAQRVGQRPVDLDDVDPDVAEYISKLEREAAGATALTPPAPTVDAPPSAIDLAARQAALVQRQVQIMAAKNEVEQRIATQYNLTPEQVTQLEAAVVEAQIIPGISQRYATKNPMGQIIQEADPAIVFNEAFEAVMATHPVFKTIRDEMVYAQRLAKEQAKNAATDAKKAAAGSLAHTPSAAVSAQGTGKPIEQMTAQERQAAMVAELAQLMASGEAYQ